MAGQKEGSGKYFIYLTNWAHISYNIYLVVSAISTTVKIVSVHFIQKQNHLDCAREGFEFKQPEGYFNFSNNNLSWYQMVQWLLFTIGNEAALFIMILYWTLLYRGGTVSGVSANTHLVNGLIALVDITISGLPVNLLHCVYLMTFGAFYSTFSGVYFIFSGNNIYSVLDYKNDTGGAVGLYLALIFLLLPFIHFLVYSLYLVKKWMLHGLLKNAPLDPSLPLVSSAAPDMEMQDLKNTYTSDESDI